MADAALPPITIARQLAAVKRRLAKLERLELDRIPRKPAAASVKTRLRKAEKRA
jgi:hypothetical protein